MNRAFIPLLIVSVFGAGSMWFVFQPQVSRADPLVAHWEAPGGGIYLDASDAQIFQLDVMHTFFFGKWQRAGPDFWSLQFYDLSGDEPVLDDPKAIGRAGVRREKGGTMLDLVMPDGGKLTFTQEGPPSPSMADLKF